MATRATRRGRREDDDTARDQWTEADEPEDSETEQDRRGQTRQLARAAPQPARRVPGQVFDPTGAIRVGLLRLARNWKEAGSTYQAIHAYTELLIRYPRTGAANAAVEELLEMAESLARQGKYYTALNIFNKLQQLY